MSENLFSLKDRVVIITGGAGLLGRQHARAVINQQGVPVLLDISSGVEEFAAELASEFGTPCCGYVVDITSEQALIDVKNKVLEGLGRIDALINNAANNPKVESGSDKNFSRLEFFPIEQWSQDFDVGVTGAFLCCKVFGTELAKRKKGVILNVASDLAVIAPDQRLYEVEGLPAEQQPVKPVTYSVVKSALVGLTRYLATYWAEDGVRSNAISPGGVYTGQPDEFVSKLTKLIPMQRMAEMSEYQGAIIFLISDASVYMNGQNIVIDGGRSCW